jgi:ABC-type glutathione transport system ATPase component
MYLGKIVELGAAADVIERPRHPYARALVSAIPRPDPDVECIRPRDAPFIPAARSHRKSAGSPPPRSPGFPTAARPPASGLKKSEHRVLIKTLCFAACRTSGPPGCCKNQNRPQSSLDCNDFVGGRCAPSALGP